MIIQRRIVNIDHPIPYFSKLKKKKLLTQYIQQYRKTCKLMIDNCNILFIIYISIFIELIINFVRFIYINKLYFKIFSIIENYN